MIVSSIGLGLFFSLLFTEVTGLLCGGLISAGYTAFFVHQPLRLAMTALVALLTLLLLKLLNRLVVLYGRRRFAVSVLSGYVIGALCALVFSSFLPMDMDLDTRTVGYIIPGLIANDMFRQGVVATFLSLAVVTVLTRLAMELTVGLL